MTDNVLAFVMAGGKGSRLAPLTNHIAKPAVAFGKRKMLDIVLANLLNSNIRTVFVLTQYAAISVVDHVYKLWTPRTGVGGTIQPVTPKMKSEREFAFVGTADAVLQNWEQVTDRPNITEAAILAGDHVYVMHIGQVVKYHRAKRSQFTICVVETSCKNAAGDLGVLRVDADNRVVGFVEKPPINEVPEIPGKPGRCYASMGNYIGNVELLKQALDTDARNPSSKHDFGHDIIPALLDTDVPVYAYPFEQNIVPGQDVSYWRDIGTISAYHAAHMEMLGDVPPLNLYNEAWPIPTYADGLAEGRSVGEDPTTKVHYTALAGGAIITHATVRWSHLGRSVRIMEDASLDSCILHCNARVERGAQLMRTIVCSKVTIPAGMRIGYDRHEDEANGLHTTDLPNGQWITVVPEKYPHQT